MTQGKGSWDQRLLFAPLSSLPARARASFVAAYTLLILLWSWRYNGSLNFAWKLPDVAFYMDMARWRYDLVPAPFCSRPLAPLLARRLMLAGHVELTTAFTALTYVALLYALVVVLWLVARSPVPRWTLLVVALVPFWPRLLGLAGVPDPLYTALLALLLLALEYDHVLLAAALMLPLMVTRESTWLTLVCLLAVAARRLRWGGSALAVAGAVLGAAFVRHLSVGSLPNPEHLSGAAYMVGKVISNALRSLGIKPWSNIYPALCGTPAWQMGLHLGKVQSIGVCGWSAQAPMETFGSLLTLFGAFPALLLALALRRKAALWRSSLVVRFCLLYGTVSLLLAPTLGTWYSRLFGYAWPLFLVAAPRLVSLLVDPGVRSVDRSRSPAIWGLFVAIHVSVCAVGNLLVTPAWLMAVVCLQTLWVALFLVHSGSSPRIPETAGA